MNTTDHYLDFEQPILDVVTRIREIKDLVAEGTELLPEKDPESEIERLEVKRARIARAVYRNLTDWQKVQVARHPQRPHAKDYIQNLITDFTPIHGDRLGGGEDSAMLSGLGRFQGQPVAVLGTEKGDNTKSRVANNFGMPKPEGYRKAARLMQMASRFNIPVITFVDTPGAYPGIDAENRGQSEAIARCIETAMNLNVPTVCVIGGEGGSGGALALATADNVLMLEHSVYSVISPEGCAGILWRQANKDTTPAAAEALQMTAQSMLKRGIIDNIIKEPVGGAHRDHKLTMRRVEEAIQASLTSLQKVEDYPATRRQRFLNIG